MSLRFGLRCDVGAKALTARGSPSLGRVDVEFFEVFVIVLDDHPNYPQMSYCTSFEIWQA